MRNKKRVLFLCKKKTSQYGISTGLLNSSLFIANYLLQQGITSDVMECIDSNDIDRHVFNYKPTHVIISAIWVPPYKLKELIYKYRNIKWQVRIHSKIPFIANEGIAFEWLVEYTKIDKWSSNLEISGNSKDFCDALSAALDIDALYLPNIYKPDYKPDVVKKINDGVVDIGCFGAIRPMKNQLMQAIAAISFGNKINKPIRFHMNAERTEQSGEQVLKNIRALFKNSHHKLIEHPWMNHYDFLKLVSQMDIGMQVSLTETFNIVCADFVYMGIPIVVSDEIDWMDAKYAVDPQDLHAISKKLFEIYDSSMWLRKRLEIFKLGRYNYKSGNTWLNYLGCD